MRVRIKKWGDDLAVQLPRDLVQGLDLKEGDTIASDALHRTIKESHFSRETALQRIKELQRPLPEKYKFDRDEANGW